MVRLVEYPESSDDEQDARSDGSQWSEVLEAPASPCDSFSYPMREEEEEEGDSEDDDEDDDETEDDDDEINFEIRGEEIREDDDDDDEDYAPSEVDSATSSVDTDDLDPDNEMDEEQPETQDENISHSFEEDDELEEKVIDLTQVEEGQEEKRGVFYAWKDLQEAFEDNPFRRRSVDMRDEEEEGGEEVLEEEEEVENKEETDDDDKEEDEGLNVEKEGEEHVAPADQQEFNQDEQKETQAPNFFDVEAGKWGFQAEFAPGVGDKKRTPRRRRHTPTAQPRPTGVSPRFSALFTGEQRSTTVQDSTTDFTMQQSSSSSSQEKPSRETPVAAGQETNVTFSFPPPEVEIPAFSFTAKQFNAPKASEFTFGKTAPAAFDGAGDDIHMRSPTPRHTPAAPFASTDGGFTLGRSGKAPKPYNFAGNGVSATSKPSGPRPKPSNTAKRTRSFPLEPRVAKQVIECMKMPFPAVDPSPFQNGAFGSTTAAANLGTFGQVLFGNGTSQHPFQFGEADTPQAQAEATGGFQMGSTQTNSRRNPRALVHTESALGLAPSSKKLQVQKVRILLHQKKFDQIVQFCTSIVEKQQTSHGKQSSPESRGVNSRSLKEKTVEKITIVGIDLGLLWATTLHYQNKVEEAVRMLNALEAVAPCSSNVIQLKRQWQEMKQLKHNGNERFKRGEYQEAVRFYSEAVQIDPQHQEFCAIIYCNRAAAQMGLERYHTAILDCNEALQRKPQYPRALLRRARCHVALKMFHEAVKDFDRYLRDQPNDLPTEATAEVRRERNEAKAAIAKAREEARQREAAKKRAEREQRQRRSNRWEESSWSDNRYYDNFRRTSSSSSGSSNNNGSSRYQSSGANSRASFMAPKTQRRTHYDVLGIEKAATNDQIKKAYRKLALVYHPDKAKTSTHADLFKEMTAAYTVLSDESARAKYDRELIYNRFGNFYES
ncbi:DnaJ subfamily C member 7 [Phytophthora cinnamomi]|uniref:DnaJ subfamily C member 7 n=1 Tax=Phytophthora cinnamomi TaxID=4785 RepID=UPI00355A1C52|nr:DnaJ subfamily C member 7 [Phytophthora cinnamomi]